MENFNKNSNNNVNDTNLQSGWEEVSKIDFEAERLQEIDLIKQEIAETEAEDERIQAQIQEFLAMARDTNPNDMDDIHAYGNFSDRFEYEVEKLSEQSYNLNVKIDGLKFKLSKLEDN